MSQDNSFLITKEDLNLALSQAIEKMSLRFENALNDVRKEIRDSEQRMNSRVDRMEAKIDQGFARVDQRFEKIDERFEKVDQRFEHIEGDIYAMKKDIRHLKKRKALWSTGLLTGLWVANAAFTILAIWVVHSVN